MPDFILSDATGVISPPTLAACLISGALLGVYFWRMEHRVQTHALWMLWFSGLSFVAVMGMSRWVDGSTHWSAWVGIGVLWTAYVLAATGVVHAWRYQIRRRLRGAT